jgi:light-regulated signal transduction histidine kinase (bacteriophytochrome)
MIGGPRKVGVGPDQTLVRLSFLSGPAPSSARSVDQAQDGADAAAERELQEFSYIVSHDLAASFRHLAGFSRLLVGELGDDLSIRQRDYADHIRAAADKCHAMVEQLLAFSRVQQKTLQRVRQDAAPSMQLAMLGLARQIREAEAEISVEPLGDVYADADLLGMAFRCLLDNAIKFRRPEVPLRITVQAASDETGWRLRIADNGCGVETAYRERAFRMFLRLNGEDAYPGVGAGLAICRRIARRHGGEAMFVDCTDGACIELALPSKSAATRPHPSSWEEGG